MIRNLLHSNDNLQRLMACLICAMCLVSASSPSFGAEKAPALTPPLLPGEQGSNFEEAMRYGAQFLAKPDYQSAANNFAAAINFNEKAPEAHVGLAYAKAGLGQIQEAMEEDFAALTINPQYWPARFHMGCMMMKKSSWDEAAGQFLQIIHANPTDLATRGNLGICYEQKGQIDTAIEQFKYILNAVGENSPASSDAHYNLACAYDLKGDMLNAVKEYSATIKVNDKHPMAYVGLANCLLNLHDAKNAEAAAKKAIELYPENYRAYISLGRIYEVLGRDKDAETQYRKSIQIAPKAPEVVHLTENMLRTRAKKLGITNVPGLN